MADTPTRYPLAWPQHRPRKTNRRKGQFSVGLDKGSYTGRKPIGVSEAVKRLDQEVERLGGHYPLLSTNLPIRASGTLITNVSVADPGVCLYFELKGQPIALACDTYSDLAQNIAALAAHLESTRAIARYGVATAEESLQAFAALPPPDHALPQRKPWWAVLNVPGGEPDRRDVTKPLIGFLYREAAKSANGDTEKLLEINLAKEDADRWLTA